jgi:hypothetical protein
MTTAPCLRQLVIPLTETDRRLDQASLSGGGSVPRRVAAAPHADR